MLFRPTASPSRAAVERKYATRPPAAYLGRNPASSETLVAASRDLGSQLISFTAGVFHRQVDRVSRHRKESRRAVGRLRLASKRFDLRIESSDLKLELTLSHVAFVATEPRVHIVASIAVPITAPWSTSGRPKSSDCEESGLCLGQ